MPVFCLMMPHSLSHQVAVLKVGLDEHRTWSVDTNSLESLRQNGLKRQSFWLDNFNNLNTSFCTYFCWHCAHLGPWLATLSVTHDTPHQVAAVLWADEHRKCRYSLTHFGFATSINTCFCWNKTSVCHRFIFKKNTTIRRQALWMDERKKKRECEPGQYRGSTQNHTWILNFIEFSRCAGSSIEVIIHSKFAHVYMHKHVCIHTHVFTFTLIYTTHIHKYTLGKE
jgi:hypothetical protein